MIKQKPKEKIELQILKLQTQRNHFIVNKISELKQDYYLIKLIAPTFFKNFLGTNLKFPLYIYKFRTKKALLFGKSTKKSQILALDSFLLKNNQAKNFWAIEEGITAFLAEITSKTKPKL